MDKQQVIDTYIEKNNKKSILGFLGINKVLGVDKAIKQYLSNENKPDITSTENIWDFLKWNILINFFLKDKKNELDKLKEYLDLNKDNKTQLENLAAEIKKWTEVEKAISTPLSQSVISNNVKQNIDINPDITDKYIKNIIKNVESKIWSPYKWWWIWPDWFDCSGLRYRALKNEWINFPQRFTAEYFDKKDLNINQNNTKVGDFMYREEEPWQEKHNDIYHIEMVVDIPFQKDWKRFVKTIWASTSDWILDKDWTPTKDTWVWYRFREITEYRHFWRPTYYQQLAQYQKTGDASNLLAA